MALRAKWAVYIDRGRGEEPVAGSEDEDKICRRIGRMVLSPDIERIIVYRNGEEYRRYELRQANRIRDISIQVDPALPKGTIKMGDITIAGIKEE